MSPGLFELQMVSHLLSEGYTVVYEHLPTGSLQAVRQVDALVRTPVTFPQRVPIWRTDSEPEPSFFADELTQVNAHVGSCVSCVSWEIWPVRVVTIAPTVPVTPLAAPPVPVTPPSRPPVDVSPLMSPVAAPVIPLRSPPVDVLVVSGTAEAVAARRIMENFILMAWKS